jgi:ABC-2 type transport system permease protein
LITISAATAVKRPVMIIYIVVGILHSPLGDLLSSSPATKITKLLPMCFIANGVSNASQNIGSFNSNLLDLGVILGTTIVLLAVLAWLL